MTETLVIILSLPVVCLNYRSKERFSFWEFAHFQETRMTLTRPPVCVQLSSQTAVEVVKPVMSLTIPASITGEAPRSSGASRHVIPLCRSPR